MSSRMKAYELVRPNYMNNPFVLQHEITTADSHKVSSGRQNRSIRNSND